MTAKKDLFNILKVAAAKVGPQRVAAALILISVAALMVAITRAAVVIPTGTVIAGTGGGLYSEFTQDGIFLGQLDTMSGSAEDTGCAFDPIGDLITTNFEANSASEFDPTGTLIGSFGSGYNEHPESVTFDRAGDVYFGQADGAANIFEFNSTGTTLKNSFAPARENRGTDWIDLAANQCTMYYTSEGVNIHTFNICTNTQGPNFNVAPLPGPTAYAHRLRPNGEVLVADTNQVVRLDATGNQIQTYTFPGTSLLFALNLDPDGTSFWTADLPSGMVFKADIASGNVLQSWRASGVPSFVDVAGLCVKGEIIVSTPTPTPTVTPTPTSTPTQAPTPPPTPTPTLTPTPTSHPPTATPTPSTPSVGGMVIPPPPVSTSASPGATVNSGTFTVQNTSGIILVTPIVMISFDNADLFASATLTGTAGPNTSTATVNPVAGGNSPEQPNSTAFVLQPPLVVPAGQTATYSLTVTVTANPHITSRDGPVMYAAMVGGRATGANALLMALALLELCAAGISTTRRRRLLMALLLLLALASQVGCDNGSVPSPPPTTTGVVQSTQTATELEAMTQQNNSPTMVSGLPVVMGTVSLK
jgi:hypothetical protein